MDRVLVTGGAGFIGSNLVEMLLGRGYEVTVLDDFSVGSIENLAGCCVEVVKGDICDPAVVDQVVKDCPKTVHLAAHTNVINSINDPMHDAFLNVRGMLIVLDAVREIHGSNGSFVFASSGAPIGNQPPPANENVAPRPLSPYGASKMAGEGYCSAFHGSYGVRTVALRFSNCYGPKSGHKTSVVAEFINEILKGKDLTIYGDGSQTRDFIHVEDICRAILMSLENERVGGMLFQVATGRETSIRELAEKLGGISGRDVKINFEDFRPGEILKNFSDISLARKTLGYEPEVSLDDGLNATFEWFRNNPET